MSNPNTHAAIYHDRDDLVTIRDEDANIYDVIYDDMTGDWLVTAENDDTIQDPWLRTRDGAIQYVLEHLGIIEDASYEFAPDRC